MDFNFNIALAERYKSQSQIARVLTEDWLGRNMYCVVCGNEHIDNAPNNAPVKDFVCPHCKSQFELKSHQSENETWDVVNDGKYDTIIQRITSLTNPNFFFLAYKDYSVKHLMIVPRFFFTPSIIQKRKPLPPTARRAGWVGCNILLNQVPAEVKIPIIREGNLVNPEQVMLRYKHIETLQTNKLERRGWLMDVLQCVGRLPKEFTSKDMYSFTDELKLKHPDNFHIPDKIRQQLQYLRDKGFVEFKGRGKYRRIDSNLA